MLGIHSPARPRAFLAGCALLAAGTAAAAPSLVHAAENPGGYPQRTITLVVPFTPGTSADIFARLIGPKVSERWKVAVVTENRPGAGGNIGAEYVARAAPDGYTLLMTATAFGTTPVLNKNTPFDPIKSFRPVGLAATSVMALVAPSKLPANSVQDLIQLARSQPGKLNYASPGVGNGPAFGHGAPQAKRRHQHGPRAVQGNGWRTD